MRKVLKKKKERRKKKKERKKKKKKKEKERKKRNIEKKRKEKKNLLLAFSSSRGNENEAGQDISAGLRGPSLDPILRHEIVELDARPRHSACHDRAVAVSVHPDTGTAMGAWRPLRRNGRETGWEGVVRVRSLRCGCTFLGTR